MPDAGQAQDFSSRYDEFQCEAINNILADYQENPAGRYLLVIPTGGGKTRTAAKAINLLFHNRVLDPAADMVVWAAHREELLSQAENTFKFLDRTDLGKSYVSRVRIMMIGRVRDYIRQNQNVRLVVIDEAHHSATENLQYGPLFDYRRLGILGLTATPSRHDGLPLEFEKESFSIGFPDLVERQVVLAPEIRSVRGGHYSNVKAHGATGFEGLSELNDAARDRRIIEHIQNNSSHYEKVIIYVGSVAHAQDLHQRLTDSLVNERYESIDYVTGTGWSGGAPTRKEFFDRIRSYKRSIVVNVDVLTEGYDDPRVNTVIMARPTRSKLVYMQAIGRCIRVDPGNVSKRAFIVEVEDELPNIRYRIDNRWLFSEISDALEPHVVDRTYSSETEFLESLGDVYDHYNVETTDRYMPAWDPRTRYSLLLFRVYVGQSPDGQKQFRHIPILIDGSTRASVSNWFNFLSERMQRYSDVGLHFEEAMIGAQYHPIRALSVSRTRKLVYEAMEEASKAMRLTIDLSEKPLPWVTFIALRHKKRALSSELIDFIAEMVNREAIEQGLLARNHSTPGWLIKLPLPLGRYIGMFMNKREFQALQGAVASLEAIKLESGSLDHRTQVRELLSNLVLGIPASSVELLPSIVKDELQFFLKLD